MDDYYSSQIHDLSLRSQQIAQWGQGPWAIPSASLNIEDRTILTQLAESILSLERVPMAAIPLRQRITLRETLISLQGKLSLPAVDQRVQAVYQTIVDRDQENPIPDLAVRTGRLISEIDRLDPDILQTLQLFKQWESLLHSIQNRERAIQQPVEQIEQLRTRLCRRVIRLFQDPKRCGPFLELLGDSMPFLFELDPYFGQTLERGGSPLLTWLQANNWWRNRDAGWFSKEMLKSDAFGNSHLHHAAQTGPSDFILSLPIDILRIGMGRPNHLGTIPLWHLVFGSQPQFHIFSRVLDLLGDIARDQILKYVDQQGNTLLHILFTRTALSVRGYATIHILARYPKVFLKMLLTPNALGVLPLHLNLPCEGTDNIGRVEGILNMVTAVLNGLHLPTSKRRDVMCIMDIAEGSLGRGFRRSRTFVPWLRTQLDTRPLPVGLLLLPTLRGEPAKLDEVLQDSSELCSRWLSDEETVRALLTLPQEVWIRLLTLRDKDGLTPLEHLAIRGDVLFWNRLREHDGELALTLLQQPDVYGFPLHHAAAEGQISFLHAVMSPYVNDPGTQQMLLALRDLERRTLFDCAEAAEQEAAMVYLLKEVRLSLLLGVAQRLANILGRQPPPVSSFSSLNELRTACKSLTVEIVHLKSDYYNRLPELERARTPIRPIPLALVFPSRKMITKGALAPNYFGQEAMSPTMKQAPPTVDFAQVLVPLLQHMPPNQPPVSDWDIDNEIFRRFSTVRKKLIKFIRRLNDNRRIQDAVDNVSLSPEFRAQIANVFRHVALYVTSVQDEMAEASQEKAQELLNGLNCMARRELIGDFGIGLFHCSDGIAVHTRQLYDYVMGLTAAHAGTLTLREQVLMACEAYRKTQFELIVSQIGGMHEATTHRYYRARLGPLVGLGGEMSALSTHYEGFAVQDQELRILVDFNNAHTPIKLVDYICGLLNDKKDKTLNKALVLDWFRERFSTLDPLLPEDEQITLEQEQIMDHEGNWRPQAVGLFLTAMGIIKLRNSFYPAALSNQK